MSLKVAWIGGWVVHTLLRLLKVEDVQTGRNKLVRFPPEAVMKDSWFQSLCPPKARNMSGRQPHLHQPGRWALPLRHPWDWLWQASPSLRLRSHKGPREGHPARPVVHQKAHCLCYWREGPSSCLSTACCGHHKDMQLQHATSAKLADCHGSTSLWCQDNTVCKDLPQNLHVDEMCVWIQLEWQALPLRHPWDWLWQASPSLRLRSHKGAREGHPARPVVHQKAHCLCYWKKGLSSCLSTARTCSCNMRRAQSLQTAMAALLYGVKTIQFARTCLRICMSMRCVYGSSWNGKLCLFAIHGTGSGRPHGLCVYEVTRGQGKVILQDQLFIRRHIVSVTGTKGSVLASAQQGHAVATCDERKACRLPWQHFSMVSRQYSLQGPASESACRWDVCMDPAGMASSASSPSMGLALAGLTVSASTKSQGGKGRSSCKTSCSSEGTLALLLEERAQFLPQHSKDMQLQHVTRAKLADCHGSTSLWCQDNAVCKDLPQNLHADEMCVWIQLEWQALPLRHPWDWLWQASPSLRLRSHKGPREGHPARPVVHQKAHCLCYWREGPSSCLSTACCGHHKDMQLQHATSAKLADCHGSTSLWCQDNTRTCLRICMSMRCVYGSSWNGKLCLFAIHGTGSGRPHRLCVYEVTRGQGKVILQDQLFIRRHIGSDTGRKGSVLASAQLAVGIIRTCSCKCDERKACKLPWQHFSMVSRQYSLQGPASESACRWDVCMDPAGMVSSASSPSMGLALAGLTVSASTKSQGGTGRSSCKTSCSSEGTLALLLEERAQFLPQHSKDMQLQHATRAKLADCHGSTSLWCQDNAVCKDLPQNLHADEMCVWIQLEWQALPLRHPWDWLWQASPSLRLRSHKGAREGHPARPVVHQKAHCLCYWRKGPSSCLSTACCGHHKDMQLHHATSALLANCHGSTSLWFQDNAVCKDLPQNLHADEMCVWIQLEWQALPLRHPWDWLWQASPSLRLRSHKGAREGHPARPVVHQKAHCLCYWKKGLSSCLSTARTCSCNMRRAQSLQTAMAALLYGVKTMQFARTCLRICMPMRCVYGSSWNGKLCLFAIHGTGSGRPHRLCVYGVTRGQGKVILQDKLFIRRHDVSVTGSKGLLQTFIFRKIYNIILHDTIH